MKKLAICVPTYERADIIEELLAKSLKTYSENNIDVFIYDSSPNERTKEVVWDYQSRFDNLSYVHIDPLVHSNMKVYKIFQEFEKRQDYEYLWVCSDAIRWTDDIIKRICGLLEEHYDFLIVNHHDLEKIGTRVLTDKNQLFLSCAWLMTLYGTTIVRIATVLNNIDWDGLIAKYTVPDKINFSHVALYFEQANKMQDFQAFHLSIAETNLIPSPLKKASGWHRDTFYVWGTCWPSMIEALPDEYVSKKAVIKKGCLNGEILRTVNFLQLRDAGIYNLRIFLSLLGKWHMLTDMSIRSLFLISILPEDFYKSEWERKQKKKIKSFCRSYTDIYIYGCGLKADRFAGYLEEMNIGYKKFLVTKKEKGKSQFRNHAVEQYTSDLLDNSHVGLIVALNEANTMEVMEKYPEIKSKRNVFSEYMGEQ